MLEPTLLPCPALVPRSPQGARGWLTRGWKTLLAAGLALAIGGSTQATSVRQMDLNDLCTRAHHIVRGEVVDIRHGSVTVGGGTLPTVTYRLKIKEALAGQSYGLFEFTSLAPRKPRPQAGGIQRMPVIELPELHQGQEYLLFTSRPSRVGLSTVVGLGQGCFTISAKGGREQAVNERGNVGLRLVPGGPVDYEVLAAKIRELLAK